MQGKYPEVETLLAIQKIRPGFSLKSLKSKKIKKENKIAPQSKNSKKLIISI